MVKKVKCHCGCGSQVSASTERRHRAGKATPRVKASHAARRVLYAPQHLPKRRRSKARLLGAHLFQMTPPNTGHPAMRR
jgi:hypothetical protein